MDADSVAKSFMCPWVNATADSATGGQPAGALVLAYRSVSAPMGVGRYLTEVPRALPVGAPLTLEEVLVDVDFGFGPELTEPVLKSLFLFLIAQSFFKVFLHGLKLALIRRLMSG